MHGKRAMGWGALCLGLFTMKPVWSGACAIAGMHFEAIRIDAEEALIVWDQEQHKEHFIRRADFRNAGRTPFGFLVPTPQRPEIAEADERVFDRLSQLYLAPPRRGAPRATGAANGGSSVEVIAVTRVAGLDAVVLRASDPQELAAWLQRNQFSTRPGLAAWLAPYVRGNWYLSAFKYTGGARAEFGSRAVRISFNTDRPFYPYAEPADQPQHRGRRLRVTVVGAARMRGDLNGTPWTATTGYAGRPALTSVLAGAIPAGTNLRDAWMTTFEERSSVRGTHDLFFVPAETQTPVARSLEPLVRYRVVSGGGAPWRRPDVLIERDSILEGNPYEGNR